MLLSILYIQNFILIYCFCMITNSLNLTSVHLNNYTRNKLTNQSNNFSKKLPFKGKKSKVISNATTVTQLLNSLLKNYNKHLHPKFGSLKKTRIHIDIFVRTMGPISEMTDTYEFNCYFRQTWKDKRLKFSNSQYKTLSLASSMLDKIWIPKTVFWNGQKSYLHTMTTPNRLVRLSSDGSILYSSRLTIKAKCYMSLYRFPLDKQICKLIIGSYAYNTSEMIYKWRKSDETRGVEFDLIALKELPQFELTGFKLFNNSITKDNSNFSILEVQFFFTRHFGYFLINYYIPCSLIVLLLWVSLWINREATGDRIALGATSFLTMTLISLDCKSDSPRVNFPTGLDIFITLCYGAIFGCMIEFTVVHVTTKFHTADPEIQRSEKEKIKNLIKNIPKHHFLGSRHYNRPYQKRVPSIKRNFYERKNDNNNKCVLESITEVVEEQNQSNKIHLKFNNRLKSFSRRDGGRFSIYHKNKENEKLLKVKRKTTEIIPFKHSFNQSIEDFTKDSIGWRIYYWILDHQKHGDPLGIHENSASTIDTIARVLFPILFILTILTYYQCYVNYPYHFDYKNAMTLVRSQGG
uniref:Neurotransmitter-gated ion-channel ligand-binding domain-containing protein n=2 Tax=Strongyloides stercoralis TaxID=6248 RepID=A0A913IBG7_STRER